MSAPGALDHLLAALLVIGLPVHGTRSYRALLAAERRGEPAARVRRYRTKIVVEWSLVAATLAIWLLAGRPLAQLGLAVPGGRSGLIGLAVTGAVLGFLAIQWITIRHLDPAGLGPLRRQLAGAAALMPTTESEHRVFRLLAVTAGICEEILCRGFLIWYFGSWVGPWPAVLLSSVVFGLGHWYQGRLGVLKTGLVGLLAGAFYRTTGSLLWPMIAHAAVDLQGGAAGRRLSATAPQSITG